MKKFLLLIFLMTACAPLSSKQGASITVFNSPFTFSDETSAHNEAVKHCGPEKKPLRTAYSPGLWFYDETTFICTDKNN